MTIRPQPCAFCPYRRDVPSGVWHEEEYRKLIAYDAPTHSQPLAPFMCHEKSGCMCSGWAQVHENRHGCELLALRLAEIRHGRIELPDATVPLFGSGNEAATHGMRDLDNPSADALRAQNYITNLQARSQTSAIQEDEFIREDAKECPKCGSTRICRAYFMGRYLGRECAICKKFPVTDHC